MKTLSAKTLEKKYREANINEREKELLHLYFQCFANLYGLISISELWPVFKKYGERIGKKKFCDFAAIASREENEFLVYDISEVYPADFGTSDRLLACKELVIAGYGKFNGIYELNEARDYYRSPFVPPKEELFRFKEDQFWKSDAGRKMSDFIDNLKTSGKTGLYIEKEIHDIDGNPVAGKKLSDFIYHTFMEDDELSKKLSDSTREKLKKEYDCTAAEKVRKYIKDRITCGSRFSSFSKLFEYSFGFIAQDLGVDFSEEEMFEFTNLYMNLNNESNLWILYGWRPDDLMKENAKDLN